MIMDNFDSPFLYDHPEINVDSLKKTIVYKLIFLIGRSPKEASQRDWLNATLYAVRDFVTEGWISTARQARSEDSRRVYYLSMEFLIGRTLSNAMIAEGISTDGLRSPDHRPGSPAGAEPARTRRYLGARTDHGRARNRHGLPGLCDLPPRGRAGATALTRRHPAPGRPKGRSAAARGRAEWGSRRP